MIPRKSPQDVTFAKILLAFSYLDTLNTVHEFLFGSRERFPSPQGIASQTGGPL